jgi:hypothetical protein
MLSGLTEKLSGEAGFVGDCWHLWLVVDDFRVLRAFGGSLRGLLAVVDDLWGLWTELGFAGCGFGVWGGFVG